MRLDEFEKAYGHLPQRAITVSEESADSVRLKIDGCPDCLVPIPASRLELIPAFNETASVPSEQTQRDAKLLRLACGAMRAAKGTTETLVAEWSDLRE